MNDAILVGYFAKATAVPVGWTAARQVTDICSVSQCIAPPPEGWMDRWIHNELGFFNSPSDALAVVPPGSRSFSLFAYRLQPVRFVNGRAESISIPTLPIDPLPHEFVALGFDIVSRSVSSFFECSPLSCNGMANEVPVNRFCLVDTLTEAVTLGERFSRERLEPGPYYIVEVLRGPAEGLV